MRVVIVTSDIVSEVKRRVAIGLGGRLVGLAAVPIVPRQVGFWRHARSLVAIAGPSGLPRMAAASLMARLTRVLASCGVTGRWGGVRGLARTLGVPHLRAAGPGDLRFRAWLADLRPDLVISLQSHQVPPEALSIPRLGWLNLHHGRLPEFRGVFSVFWAMHQGERLLHATAHLMGTRLDDGPVIAEEAVAVADGASVDEMEARMWAMSPSLLLRAVQRLESDAAPQVERPDAVQRYYTYPTRTDVRAARSTGLRMR